MTGAGIINGQRDDMYCPAGYARDCPFGCVDQGLLSVLYFLPGQSMRPHRHLDSDEYFTAVSGNAEMYVNGRIVPLLKGQTFLRSRGVLHAIRNSTDGRLIVQSFQSPIPSDAMCRWETVEGWGTPGPGTCPRCWCGQIDSGTCVNCGAPLGRVRRTPRQSAV